MTEKHPHFCDCDQCLNAAPIDLTPTPPSPEPTRLEAEKIRRRLVRRFTEKLHRSRGATLR